MTANNRYIIASRYQQESIYRDLLQINEGFLGIDVIALPIWLSRFGYSTIDKQRLLINVYKAIQEKNEQFTVLKDTIKYPSVAAEMIEFYQNITRYEITVEDLPINRPLEREIRLMALLIREQLPDYQSELKLIRRLPLISNTAVYPGYRQAIIDQRIEQALLAQGAKLYPLEITKPTQISLYKALNKRQEIEALAQYLLQTDELTDTMIILANPTDYLPWIKQIFCRYRLPYSTTITERTSVIFQRYRKLLKLIAHPDSEQLRVCLQNQCFTVTAPQLNEYLTLFELSFSACLQPFDVLADSTADVLLSQPQIAYAQLLIQQSEQQRQRLETVLKAIAECPDELIRQAQLAYDLLKATVLNPAQRSELYQIKQLLETCLPLQPNVVTLNYLLEQLQPMQAAVSTQQLLVTTVEQSIGISRRRKILVGADNTAFPSIPLHQGIADESYYAQLNYPTKDERYDFTMRQLKRTFEQCEQLIVSYAYGDFSGKSRKIAFELETIISQMTSLSFLDWPLQENNALIAPKHQLAPPISQKLFFVNDELNGSVSSFELFYRCPYQYFIQRGMKVYITDLRINNAMLGTLLHQIIESLIKNYNADYSACPTAELSKFVDEGFSQLYQLYPRQKAAIDLIKQKLLMTITRSLAVLRQLERSQNFKPLAAEQPFQTAVQLKNIRMNLRGVIDRIDTDAEYYRIIDYKSSDHKPSENDFNKGLQLQLLTYLWLMQEQIAKKPYGAYYFSFSDKYTKVTAAKYRRTNHTLEVYDQTDWYETFMKEHQFAGWSFIDTEDKKIFSLEDISARLLALYQQLADRLLAGDINPQPQNEACKYCTYLGICRYYQQDEPAETSENSDEE